jgi:hypothetical protein
MNTVTQWTTMQAITDARLVIITLESTLQVVTGKKAKLSL